MACDRVRHLQAVCKPCPHPTSTPRARTAVTRTPRRTSMPAASKLRMACAWSGAENCGGEGAQGLARAAGRRWTGRESQAARAGLCTCARTPLPQPHQGPSPRPIVVRMHCALSAAAPHTPHTRPPTVVRMLCALCSNVTRTKGMRSGYLVDRSAFRKSERVPGGLGGIGGGGEGSDQGEADRGAGRPSGSRRGCLWGGQEGSRIMKGEWGVAGARIGLGGSGIREAGKHAGGAMGWRAGRRRRRAHPRTRRRWGRRRRRQR